jgi:hypothetical protein
MATIRVFEDVRVAEDATPVTDDSVREAVQEASEQSSDDSTDHALLGGEVPSESGREEATTAGVDRPAEQGPPAEAVALAMEVRSVVDKLTAIVPTPKGKARRVSASAGTDPLGLHATVLYDLGSVTLGTTTSGLIIGARSAQDFIRSTGTQYSLEDLDTSSTVASMAVGAGPLDQMARSLTEEIDALVTAAAPYVPVAAVETVAPLVDQA